nr:protein NUCLEAR FUSION DEFECTIVE 4-like [Ipomoea batatas]
MGFGVSSTSPTANKWIGFVTAVWVQAISGNNYTFSNYSDALKTLMALTQLQLNNLSVAKDVGKAFGILAGIASDRLPTPVILLIGSVEGFIGYGVQWLVVSGRIQPLPYWAMCIFLCMGGNSTTWMNTAILVTCIRNFRKNRGPVSGILKGYVGLSTAIFTDICSALFADDPAKFLLMLAVVPFVVCLTAVFFLREVPPSSTAAEEKEEAKYFGVVNIIAIVIAVYLLVFDVSGPHGRLFSQVFAAVLLVLLASPLSLPPLLAQETLPVEKSGDPAPPAADDDVTFQSLYRSPAFGDFWAHLSGSVSEYFIKKAGTPRPVWNAASQILMAVGYIMMAMALPGSLYVGSIVVGIAMEFRLAVTVPTASELFASSTTASFTTFSSSTFPGSFLFSGFARRTVIRCRCY